MRQHFPLLFTLFALLTLLSLGTWQVFRLQEKNEYQAKISERMNLPPLDDSKPIGPLDENEFRSTTLTGKFLHDQTFYVFTGPIEHGGNAGYFLITPLQRKDKSLVLVNRGFVPQDKKLPETRPETLTQGTVTFTGMIHQSEKPRRFVPKNDALKNFWFTIDVPAMEHALGKPVDPYFVRVLKDENTVKNSLPIAGEPTIHIFNPHLEYAITWYLLSVILCTIYVLFQRGQRKGKK